MRGRELIISVGGLATLFLLASVAAGADIQAGKALFTKMKCHKCHAPEVKKTGPALRTIANSYKTVDKLVLYFQGKSEPIVEPERAKTMRPRRRKLAKLSEEEQRNLAAFYLSFKK